jgi:hypothetical protein
MLTLKDATNNRMSESDIDDLNMHLLTDDDGNIDIAYLPAGVKVVHDSGTCLLCKVGNKYVNLWIGADDKSCNGFDSQVELHFEDEED